ncbi:MAG: Gfo/Idh/MocA family oxidoreductase [Thaumarchaeota archaeon]|nr:Gfo/Idh/MocA family oxidoreductase [Nitrososphaerota archaeon]
MTRIGVIGTGGWGKNHLRALYELGALAAICEIDKQKLSFYTKKYQAEGYASTDRMFSQEKLDGVLICTPTSTHYLIASKALEKGIDVFVEKPLTYDSSEGDKLVGLAQSKHVNLVVGYIERFNPAVSELAKILEKGDLGQPLLLEFHRENRWQQQIKDVGIILDTSVHDIDTARWLFREEPREVFARTGKVIGNHEDFATIILSFSGEKTAFIASNWVTPKKVRQLDAVCTNGTATVDFISQELQLDDASGTRIPRLERQEPLMLELRNFVDTVEGKAKPLVEGRDAVQTTRVAEAALKSAQIGEKVAIKSLK